MRATLLHYFNESTDDEYLVIKSENDDGDYAEEGYKLENECPLLNVQVTLPLGSIFTRD